MRSSVDRTCLVLAPAETARAAEVAVRVRGSILLGDPDTGSFDHLAAQVRSGLEAIWFWGPDTEIARLRAVLTEPPDVLPRFGLGTMSVLSVEDEFGPGHGAVCRFAVPDSSFLAGTPTTWHSPRYHTLVLAPRDRPSTSDLAVPVASRFWGHLPCRLTRSDVLAPAELRESNRDPADVLRALAASLPWHFAEQAEGRFAAALTETNFGRRPEIVVSGTGTGDHRGYQVLMPRIAALTSATHATVRPADAGDSPGFALSTAVRKALRSWVCCCAVHLPLTDPDTIPAQRWLLDHGFRLSAVVPPKRTWLVSAGRRRDVEVPATGVWTLTPAVVS